MILRPLTRQLLEEIVLMIKTGRGHDVECAKLMKALNIEIKKELSDSNYTIQKESI